MGLRIVQTVPVKDTHTEGPDDFHIVERDAVDWTKALLYKGRVASTAHEIAQKYGVSIASLKHKSRVRKIAYIRQEIYYTVLSRYPDTSLTQIGKWFRRDHTTIGYGAAAHAWRNGLSPARAMSTYGHKRRRAGRQNKGNVR